MLSGFAEGNSAGAVPHSDASGQDALNSASVQKVYNVSSCSAESRVAVDLILMAPLLHIIKNRQLM